MTSSQFKTAKAHEEPYAVQFSIFLANRIGQLKDLMNLFDQQNIRLLGLSIIDSTDWAVVRTVLGDPDKARRILQAGSVGFTESHVLLVQLADASIASICTNLLSAEVSVHFAYPLIVRRGDNPIMVFQVDDRLMATQVLKKHGVPLLSGDDLDEPDAG